MTTKDRNLKDVKIELRAFEANMIELDKAILQRDPKDWSDEELFQTKNDFDNLQEETKRYNGYYKFISQSDNQNYNNALEYACRINTRLNLEIEERKKMIKYVEIANESNLPGKILVAFIGSDFDPTNIIERLKDNASTGVCLVNLASLESLAATSREKLIVDLLQRTRENNPNLYTLNIPEADYGYADAKPSKLNKLEKIKQAITDDIYSRVTARSWACPVKNNPSKNYSTKAKGYFGKIR